MTHSPIRDNFLSTFPDIGTEYLSVPGYIQKLRREANAILRSQVFPTSREEYWKYNRFSFLDSITFNPPEKPLKSPSWLNAYIRNLEGEIAIIINGKYVELIPDPLFSVLGSLNDATYSHPELLRPHLSGIALPDRSFFHSLNAAHWTDGVFILVPENKMAEKPVHIIHLATEGNHLSQPRFFIYMVNGSKLNVAFHFLNEQGGGGFTNAVCEVMLNERAVLNQHLVQTGNEKSSLLFSEGVHQEKGSRFFNMTSTLSGKWTRNNIDISVEGEHCHSELLGIYVPTGEEFTDNHTRINHNRPNCESNELYKGVLNERASAVFNGKLLVSKGAQKTNAYQSNKNVILSDMAAVYSKPELEIYADDVKCSHGSATGALDEKSLFYLRSRGLPPDVAKKILVNAFANEIISHCTIPSIKIVVEDLVSKKFS